MMGSLQADIGELSHHLKQERLFVDAEKQQILNLNEKVTKAIERAYHASWVRGEQRRNYDDLILRPQHSSPPACCQRVNLLDTLNFVDAYKVLGYNESLYGDFLSVLRNDPHVVARCLVLGEAHNQEAMQTAAHTIFATVYASGLLPEDETHILNLLKNLSELQLAPSENPRRQLRHGSCAFSQIYRAYVEMLPQSKVFLTAALHQPIIQLLMEDELFLDIDPSKAAVRFPPEERLRRFGEEGTPEYAAALGKYRAWTISKLVKITNRFIESIKEAMNCFPGSLSWLVRILYDVLLTAKVTEMREVSAICVDLIFGLFLCPALVTPEPHGICDAPISYISRFNLMQVAQILQVLAMSRWETPDHRLNDLYSQFDKEIVASLLDNIIEQEGSENPPCLVGYNNPLLGLERSSFLCPEPNIMSLISFIQTLLPEFPEDDVSRKELEALLSRIKPPPPKSSNTASTSTPPNISPTTANSSTTPNTISPSVTPKKNLLGRVKSNRLWDEMANGTLIVSQAVRARSSKSQCEGDGDSLKSGEDTSSLTTNSGSGGTPHSGSTQGLGGSTEEGDVEAPALEYDTVLVISLRGAGGFSDCPGLMAEEKVLNSLQQANKTSSRVRIDEDSASNGGDVTIEKRTRFSLSHDEGSIGNTSDNLEAISEAASNHSVASSLDDVEQEDQPDNLSDMVSANVSGRGTPNVSGRDTPSSQITEGETEEMRRIAEQQPPPPNVPVTVPKPARQDIEEKFGRFEIKPLIGGDETTSMVSDTWSTDVLASDSETIEAADRSDRGDQFHDQLFNRHLAELDSMQGSYGGEGGETFDTASQAWSTDVLASDSERLQEFDTDDAQSVTRSDDTGRSEVDGDMGRDDLVGEDLIRPEQFYRNKDDNITPRAHSSRSPVDGAFSVGGLRGGLSPVVGGILKPTPSHPSPLTLGESAHSSGHAGVMPTTGILKPIPRRDSHDSAASSGVVAASTPPRVEFHPIHPPPPQTTHIPQHEMGGHLLDSGVGAPPGGPQDNMVSSATQSLGRLSLNLSDLPNNGCVQADKHLLLNSFIGDANSTGPLIDLGSGPAAHEGGVGIGVSSSGGHKLLHSDRGSGEDSSLHLSTTSLASSSSSEKSGQQPYDSTGSDVGGGGGKIRSTSNASASSGGGQDGISNDSVDTPEPTSAPVISGSPSMSATGAIPKSISFDKTAERGDKDSIDGDAKHKRGFFKNFKLPGFKGRRKPGGSSRTGDELPFVRPGVVGQDVTVRRAHSEDSRPPIIEESSDDILARYRSKKPNLDTSEPDSGVASADQGISSGDLVKTEVDERLYVDPTNIEASYAFTDAKRKLRLVLSIADFSTSPQPTAGDRRGLTDNDILLWLQSQLAEAINLNDRSLVAQLHETIRCVQLFDAQGRGQLISCLRSDYQRRSPYVSYLVRSRQGLLTVLAHMDKLNDRINVDANVICNSMVGLCVRLFLEKRDKLLSEFTYDFTQLTVPDEKVQLVENFLTKLYGELERDPMWISSTEEQLLITQLALERIVMSHIYIHALYPNGDGDVSRDQVLHEHMKKLGAIITPNHKDLRITKVYQYECPWPSAQADITQISAYKTARDKIKCVVRASRTIMNLLSLAHDQSVPAADDFLPVLVYVLIKANPPALLSTVQYVNLFYEQRIEGEDQYWWTQFCSAIEFIKIQIYMTKYPKSS